MVDLLFVRIRFSVGLAYTFGDHFRIALLVTSVLAIGTLHAGGILQEVTAQRTAHDVVESLDSELVAILLDHIFLLLADCTLSIEADIKRSAIFDLLDEAERELYPANRLK